MKYKDSGVDIDAATSALGAVRQAIRSTWGEQVASDVGSFGGLFRQPDGTYLVSSVDGVGTKLLVGLACDRIDGVGADLVNHCVNDILVQGASPLFFLDYFATARLDGDQFRRVIEGMAQACRENGCALIGGETAEMPGLYREGEFDLAGCIVGRVTPEELLTGEQVQEGMHLYAWPSSGLHTNGYSLVRRALLDSADPLPLDADPGSLGVSLGEALMAVHRSYLAPVRAFRSQVRVAALCHITGGGLIDNLPRVLPEGLAVEIDASSWTVPPLFGLIATRGAIEVEEMRRVFNLGVGMVAIAPKVDAAVLASMDDPPWRLGRVRAREADAVLFSGRHIGLP